MGGEEVKGDIQNGKPVIETFFGTALFLKRLKEHVDAQSFCR
jgi:hypothetical protein